ncbi:MAG: TCR/Tet family MFS transporter [Planctomycetota bacterium]
MTNRTPAIGFIFVTLLLDVLGFGLLIPVAPRLIAGIQGLTVDEVGPTVGILAATYSAMQFLFSPTLGALSDRYGRRPILLIALFGSGLDYFALAFAPNMAFLYITRAINGLSGASMSTATAYIADITPPEKRAGAFGMIGAAFGLGFILGPVMGGFLGEYDIRYPFYAAGALSLMNWLYGYFVLPESLPPERRATLTFAKANPIGVFRGLGKYPLVMWMAGALFLLNLAQYALHTTWVIYTEHRYHWNGVTVGLSLTTVGIGAAVVQGGLARKIIPWLGERRSLLFGIGLGVLSYAAYGTATQGWMIFVIVAIASIGGIAAPAAQSMITRSVRPDEQGRVQGALSGLQSVANFFGPLMGTTVLDYFISERAPVYLPGASFYMSAMLALLGLGVAWVAMTKSRNAEREAELTVGNEKGS